MTYKQHDLMLQADVLNVIMLGVAVFIVMLSAGMLNVVMLNAVEPKKPM
jgi:hypothetical protein